MDSVVARILGCRCLCGADREKGPLEKSLNTTVRTVYIPQHGNKNGRPVLGPNQRRCEVLFSSGMRYSSVPREKKGEVWSWLPRDAALALTSLPLSASLPPFPARDLATRFLCWPVWSLFYPEILKH